MLGSKKASNRDKYQFHWQEFWLLIGFAKEANLQAIGFTSLQ